jgi:hypothetical protein
MRFLAGFLAGLIWSNWIEYAYHRNAGFLLSIQALVGLSGISDIELPLGSSSCENALFTFFDFGRLTDRGSSSQGGALRVERTALRRGESGGLSSRRVRESSGTWKVREVNQLGGVRPRSGIA